MNQKKFKTIIERLRNPQQSQATKTTKAASATPTEDTSRPVQKQNNFTIKMIGGIVFTLVILSLIFIFSAQHKAVNIAASLEPKVLKGLEVNQDFSPNKEKRYVQISEGQERNVTVTGKGAASTLPVISRFNYKALTPQQYQLIGAAPWNLSINVTSNLDDSGLLRYLFNQEKTIEGFVSRPDVEPYLQDPVALAKLATNEKALKSFFAEEAVQNTLKSEKVFKALVGSRLFGTLLISKSVKFYRDHPQEAAKLINASPTLSALKRSPMIQQAVKENVYLKNISDTLLK